MLASVLDDVGLGRSRLVWLEGAAGTGKSVLLAAAREDARRRGWMVLSGSGAVLETGNAFGVMRQVLRGAVRDGRVAPKLAAVGEHDSPFEVFEAALEYLCDAVGGGPVLITVDDLAWCDSLSLRWLAYLAHRRADLPVALVLAGSAEETGERHFVVDELTAGCRRHVLRPLTPAQLGPWVAGVLDERPDDAFVARCHRATGGNATLLAALLRELAARSVRPVRESADAIAELGPDAVRPHVLPWIERGGSESPAVARAVAILGEDSEPVLVAALAGLGRDRAAAAADRLIRLGVLCDASPLRYAQPLVRAVVDTGMSAGSRDAMRMRAARLARDYYTAPDRAAAHLMAVDISGEPWALDTLRAAAGSARNRGEPAEAPAYLRRALAEPMPVAARAELLADLGAAEIAAGAATAESTLLDALDLAADPRLRARIGGDLLRTDAAVGLRLTPAPDLADKAAALVGPDRAERTAEAAGVFSACVGPLDLAAKADALTGPERAGFAAESGGFLARTAAPGFVEAAGALTRLEGAESGAEAGVFLAGVTAPGFAELGERLSERGAGGARPRGLAGVVDAWHEVRRGGDRAACVRLARGVLCDVDPRAPGEFGLRLVAAASLVIAEAYDLTDDPAGIGGGAHRCGTAGDMMIGRYLYGRALYDRGELERARTELTAALADAFVARMGGAARLAGVLVDAGDVDAADRVLRRYAPEPAESRTWRTIVYGFARAVVAAARERHEEAMDGFLDVGRGLRELGIDNPAVFAWRSQAARGAAALGDIAAAKSLAADEVDLARRWGAPRTLSAALAAFAVVNSDPAAAREAVAVLDPGDAGPYRAKALVDLGAIEVGTGATGPGQEHLQEGFALAERLGAKGVSVRAARLIRGSGGRPDLRRVGGVSALTAQERAAAEHAATGATNRQIAEVMVLTQRTVEQYLTNVYRKLNITGRRQLAAAIAR